MMQPDTTQVQLKKLLAQVRNKMGFKQDSFNAENTHFSWIKQFIIFHVESIVSALPRTIESTKPGYTPCSS
jgi:hypothetical protein